MSALPAPSFPYCGGALIASPSRALREQVVTRLNGRCRPVQHALGGADALAQMEKGNWQVLFLDRSLPDLDTEELMTIIQRRFPDIQVVLLDSAGALPVDGVNDKVRDESSVAENREAENNTNPVNGNDEAHTARSGVAAGGLTARAGMREAPQYPPVEPLPGMIGTSGAMLRVARLVRLVAPRSTTVLVAGPTGSGKELVARALHTLSPRTAKPLVVINCAAVPEALLESELFGYARGAFTGAVQAQMGRITAAHGGTLFLDEVSEMPLGMQAKLLRFLEQKEVQRLGASEVSRVDVRVLAASNVDLAARVDRGEFREDLFYRLTAFPIELPPLAERRADILVLAEHFLACMAAAMGAAAPRLSAEAVGILEGHPWRGNVRELQHAMERASILVEHGDTVRAEHLYFSYPQSSSQSSFQSGACAAPHGAASLRRILEDCAAPWHEPCTSCPQ